MEPWQIVAGLQRTRSLAHALIDNQETDPAEQLLAAQFVVMHDVADMLHLVLARMDALAPLITKAEQMMSSPAAKVAGGLGRLGKVVRGG